ncbi:HRDC domain-containing protein [Acinetobacter johnsonii]|jgi:ribonuclease D|uniref:HRDC domain-containing protein n=4 Tax=Acinetobacter TaxID=469 RepID=A0A3R9ESL5_ACIJO|nr:MULTISPECIES: HRDC domain-containing protein [Acinetobacter]OHC22873.1 MAG: ribonuclease D [Pseudomonadales bacterium RIFCSPHIGHO2_12_FULL_40_16]AZN63831.1 ribonuclease D [Acinetobacter johnsonii]ENV71156.1 ribonuclease D [Acinetobacter johnsonii ANC 3681]MCF7643055.1 HRDC domain-containing protein [Acinetobacter johnsonii]MDH0836166.1 HRDC domain-containing protein [Acinetobacter johnsonii]
MFQFIQQQQDLTPVLEKMDRNEVYGLDTEFIKVDTLWPKLGVFQINVENNVYLLDGTTLDLTEFWNKLFRAQQNVFHACSEDIDLIYHYAQHKTLNNVFDTQVGMSFLGHGLQVSYQNALKQMLDVDIDKGETRSNWLARPLSPAQLSYAANDVLYLMNLSEKVKQELDSKSLLNFALEDCQHLTQEIATETPLHLLYQDIGNYRHSRRQLMQLQQLAVWREHMVKALNTPRSFILKNSSMIDLVEKNPKNAFQLSGVKDIRQNVVREHGKTILDLVKFLPEQADWPLRMARPIRHSSKDVGEKIDHLIQNVVNETSIPKEVLMRKKWMNALHQHVVFHNDEQDLPDYLLGWRYDLLTQPLIQLLRRDESYLSTQMKVMD